MPNLKNSHTLQNSTELTYVTSKNVFDYILEVALPVPLFQTFDYSCNQSVKVGQRVWVKFRHREISGVVIGTKVSSEFENLSEVIAVLDNLPILCDTQIGFLRFIANYYAEPFGMVLKASMPAPFRKQATLPDVDETGYQLNELGLKKFTENEFSKSARKQVAFFDFMQSIRTKNDVTKAEFSGSFLCKFKGYLSVTKTNPYADQSDITFPLTLSYEQQRVYDDIASVSTEFGSHLIHGVTGSGKTEVYMRLIADTIARGQQVLMLVPEIGLTPQTLSRLQGHFGNRVAVSHSNINDNKRAKLWQATSQGKLPILVGTRSAIFYPFRDLGLVLVDEEHDDSYKQSDGFAYNARDLTIVLAKRHNIPAVFGSATPSLAILANVKLQKTQLHKIEFRVGQMPLPYVKYLDMRVEPKRSGIAETLISHLQKVVKNGEQALIFINRRGYAPVLKCEQCEWASECKHCDSHQTTHLSRRQLMCHHCGNQSPLPVTCPSCQSNALYHAGAGTEKIEQILQEQIPFARLLRLDRDNQSTDIKLHHALEQIHQHEVDIIIGTQLIAKGHHFAILTNVCILDCDGGLYSGDYRAEERLLQQIIQVAGRPGREQKRGLVHIQTAVPDHPMFQAILTHDYLSYANTLIEERENQGLPPFSGMALLKASHKNEHDLRQFLLHIKIILESHLPIEVKCLGPAPALLARRSNRYFYHLVILAPNKMSIQRTLKLLIEVQSQFDKNNHFHTRVDVDPYSQY